MTAQTRHYIEVSDIIALRSECRKCHAVLTLPLANDVGQNLLHCPRCREPWTKLEYNTYEVLVSEFASKADQLAKALPFLGLALTLEIKAEAKP